MQAFFKAVCRKGEGEIEREAESNNARGGRVHASEAEQSNASSLLARVLADSRHSVRTRATRARLSIGEVHE